MVFQDHMSYDLTARKAVGPANLSTLRERSRIEDAACRAGAGSMAAALPRGDETLLSSMFTP